MSKDEGSMFSIVKVTFEWRDVENRVISVNNIESYFRKVCDLIYRVKNENSFLENRSNTKFLKIH